MSDLSESDRAELVADHYGLTFHIEYGVVIEHRGWKSEEREATEEEREMWTLLDRRAPCTDTLRKSRA